MRLAVGEAPPLLCAVWILVRPTLAMFVPLMGRAGTDVPSDVIVGALFGVLVALVCLTSSSLFALAPKPPTGFRRALLAWAVVAALLASSTFPYTAAPPRLKRVFLQHTVRTVRAPRFAAPLLGAGRAGRWANRIVTLGGNPCNNCVQVHGQHGAVHRDSGVWVITMDYNDLKPIAHLPGYDRCAGRRHSTDRVGLTHSTWRQGGQGAAHGRLRRLSLVLPAGRPAQDELVRA